MIPFTEGQFLEVFSAYNRAVFPMQFALIGAAIAAVRFSLRRDRTSSRLVAAILTVLWLWMAIAYHLMFFSEINKLAYVFAAAFVIQALIFLIFGVIRDELSFSPLRGFGSTVGVFVIVYALIIYPILNYVFDHRYPASPTFGVPCPTTIFTFGFLLWTNRNVSILFLMIPIMWSVVSIAAVFQLGIYEDSGLVVTGILATLLLLSRDSNKTN